MALSDVLALLVPAVRDGRYRHVARPDLEEKNWLASRRISPDEVAEVLTHSRDAGYTLDPLRGSGKIFAHIFVVAHALARYPGVPAWYLKFYFEPSVGWRVFSVHPSEE